MLFWNQSLVLPLHTARSWSLKLNFISQFTHLWRNLASVKGMEMDNEVFDVVKIIKEYCQQ